MLAASHISWPPHPELELGQAEPCGPLDIECRAGQGARAAVKPWVIAAAALGAVGAILGTVALVRSL